MNVGESRLFLSPAKVYFTQNSVAKCFQIENDLNETCEEIVEGKKQVEKFENIQVVFKDGKYFSVDNRRLYVFRVLNLLELLNRIQVKKVNQFDPDKFTTQNNGCHVFLRNRREVETYRHCPCDEERNMPSPRWWDNNSKCHVNLVKVPRRVQENSSTEKSSVAFRLSTWSAKIRKVSSPPSSGSITKSTNQQNITNSANLNEDQNSDFLSDIESNTDTESNTETPLLPNSKQKQTQIRPESSSHNENAASSENSDDHNENAASSENSDNCFVFCLRKVFCCCL